MVIQKAPWKKQTLAFDTLMHEALLHQHQAVQFIALAGKYLIKQEADDSNTNMQFFPDKLLLAGNKLSNGKRLALNPDRLEMYILDERLSAIRHFSLIGKSKKQVFDSVKKILSETGTDTAAFSDKLHYDLPVHDLDNGAVFSLKKKSCFLENTLNRYNAEIILSEIAAEIEGTAAVRVWPHHFDTGTFIPLAHNKSGALSKSIGLGWAIPDSMVAEPYYYLSLWSENPVTDFKTLPKLSAGNWNSQDWNGGILKHSEILAYPTAREQYQHVKLFLNSGISILQKQYA